MSKYLSKEGREAMDVYKKSFGYVPEYRIFGYLAVLISAISAFLMVFG